MAYDFSQCMVLNTRMAARAVTRRYESQLRGHGVTAAQFSLLAAVQSRKGVSITEIAERLAMDRTTASRNLDLLARKGLVLISDGSGGSRRACQLSLAGADLLDRLLPLWQLAQEDLKVRLGGADVNAVLAHLRLLSKV